jgi:hypothetical protein
MPLKLLSSGGGSVLLTANTTASDFTVNVPAVNGNMVTTADTGSITQSMLGAGVYAGYGPAFSAYLGTNQSVSAGTYTKIQYDTKVFDTANCFSTTNYRFTPNVAGYYQINGSVGFGTSSLTRGIIYLFKNGSSFLRGTDIAGTNIYNVICSSLIYLNGTTDYVELYGWLSATTPYFYGSSQDTVFSGFLARAA